jgi:uncharacterized membrane protein YfcA
VGLAAVIEYYRHGNIDLRAGLIVAVALLGAWFGAVIANHLRGQPVAVDRMNGHSKK